MTPHRFHTLHTPCSERAEHWAWINAQHFGHLQVEEMDTTALHEAQLEVFALEDLRLFLIDAPAHRVRRGAAHPHDELDDTFKLLLQRQGRAFIEQGGQRVELRPGDWSLYDPRLPYTIHNTEPASLLAVQIPRERLCGLKLAALHASASAAGARQGLSAVMSAFLGALAQQIGALPPAALRSVGESLLGLLTSTVLASRSEALARPLPAVLRQRVRQYMLQHLGDVDLNAARIARAMRCSERYLFRVFEDDALSLERTLWQMRLERCRAQLQEARAPASVAEIAFANGFRSPAHFSRLFKAETGLSPRAYRQALGAPAQAAR